MAYLIRFLRGFNFAVTLIFAILLCCSILLFQDYHHPTDLGITSKGIRIINQESVTIHLAETSGKPHLDAREACSIESAARHHPECNVTLYSIGILSPSNPYVTALRYMSNVHVKHLNLSELFRGTPLDQWNRDDRIRSSSYPVTHLSDAVRLALVWKHGGIYLDTDVIVVRPFRGLSNAVALQNDVEVNGAILVFDQNSSFLSKCMVDYVERFQGEAWDTQGPALFTRNLVDHCNSSVLTEVVNRPTSCQGVTLLTPASFYPLPYQSWAKLFEPVNDVDLSTSYAVHLWAKMSRDQVFAPGTNSLIEDLARNNCPLVYENMKKNKTI